MSALIIYTISVFFANWLIRNWGTITIPGGSHLVPVGFGLMAPSGVYAAGLTFVARDLIQRSAGRGWSVLVILPAAALSAFLSPGLALASGSAFLFSELVDFVVFTPLQRRGLVVAVFISGIVASLADSWIFLTLAGIPLLAALPGLILGKVWVQIVTAPLIAGVRRVIPVARTT